MNRILGLWYRVKNVFVNIFFSSDYSLSPQESKSLLLRRVAFLAFIINAFVWQVLTILLLTSGNVGNPLLPIVIAQVIFAAMMVFVLHLASKGYSRAGAILVISSLVVMIYILNPRGVGDGTHLIYFVIPIFLSGSLLKPASAYWTALAICVGIIILYEYYSFSTNTLNIFFSFGTIAVTAGLSMKSLENYADYVYVRNERLEAVEELRSKLIADISHELRTPISNISAYVELADEEQDAMSLERIISVLKNETQKAVKLINQIVDALRTERYLDPDRMISVHIVNLIHGIAETESPIAEEKGLALMIIAPDDHLFVDGQIAQIEKIFFNLIADT